MARGMDNEAGGAADLQTDVMRFMAILSLCLVAIFALVQSLPLVQTESPPTPLPEPEPQVPVTESIDIPEPITKPQPAARKTTRKAASKQATIRKAAPEKS